MNNKSVLVYYGTYIERDILNSKLVFMTHENNELASYKKYKDIETDEEYIVPYEECKEFEEEHKIINIKFDEEEDLLSSFNEIKEDFLNGIKPIKKEMTMKLIKHNI